MLDIRGGSIVTFDTTGNLIARLGKNGQGPGEFQHIVGWSVSEQGLEIIASGNLTISKLNLDGSFIKSQKINRTLTQGDYFDGGRYVICSLLNQKEKVLEIFNTTDSSFTKITGTILDGKEGMAYSGYINTNDDGLGILSGYFHGFITCFNDSGRGLYNKLTIDRTPPPKIIHECGNGGMGI